MKKKVWIGMLATIAVLSVSLLLMVACKKKEAPQAPTRVNANVSGTTIKITWNRVENADSYSITNGNGSSLGDTYSTSYTDYSPSEAVFMLGMNMAEVFRMVPLHVIIMKIMEEETVAVVMAVGEKSHLQFQYQLG